MPVPGWGEPHPIRLPTTEEEQLRQIADIEGRSPNQQIKHWVIKSMRYWYFERLLPDHISSVLKNNGNGKR